MKKTAIANIYNFIRKSHVEPSEFIIDDFETIRNQLILMKQLGLPGTYALKYDALMDPHYQELLKDYLDENDEISAWWEIPSELCRRAGIGFRDSSNEEVFDDRVNSAYSLGYTPEERIKLVDAYMADFYAIFGKYPQTIGSWVIDNVTLQYAHERYGVCGACICRDQMATDGFTLWGGWPNGVYFPSRKNMFLPASTEEGQLNMPVFRMLGPDPIYNFEAGVRDRLEGVYTLEPAWLSGRDMNFIRWIFGCLTDEDALGVGYAQVGQENNFLWENIRPGFGPQLHHLEELLKAGKIRVETLAQSARWYRQQYRLTPPVTYQASRDWNPRFADLNLSTQTYACCNYRASVLGEQGHMRIRDLFLYRENYPCRYLEKPMEGVQSLNDALPVLFPQIWGAKEDRPFIRLRSPFGTEPRGRLVYDSLDALTARARLMGENGTAEEILMDQAGITFLGKNALVFDRLPVFKGLEGREILMEHEGFPYSFTVEEGRILRCGADGIEIVPEDGRIRLVFGADPGDVQKAEVPFPVMRRSESRPIPPMTPVAEPADSVFPWGTSQTVTLSCHDEGTIRFTLDGTDPDENSPVYVGPFAINRDCCLKARLFTPEGKASEILTCRYRFGLKNITLKSAHEFDWRPSFSGNGPRDLLNTARGTLDYLDGAWRGGLTDIDITGTLETPAKVESITMGFLSHHRSGLVYPERVELYVGPDKDHLTLKETFPMPHGPHHREIVAMDAELRVDETIGAFRIVARRYEKMPQWCCYRGITTVFTMADNIIVKPAESFTY